MFKIKRLVVAMAMVCFSIMAVQDVAALGECDCQMTPTNMTIARGTSLEFDVTVTNNTSNVGRVSFGGKITQPSGATTDWVFGPIQIPLTAFGEQSTHIKYSVPSSGPVGRYTYHSYVWAGGSLFGECEFDFIVPADVPKTGQTTSYETGDDGDLQTGTAWPNPRFTDNGDGTVTDNMTGLVWLKDANCYGQRTWTGALSDCNTLSSGECGLTDGSAEGDWRLPNRKELQSLIHDGFYDPVLSDTSGTGHWSDGDPFTGVQMPYYWSATTCAFQYGGLAWYVGMHYGHVGYDDKSNNGYVWPVRGGQ